MGVLRINPIISGHKIFTITDSNIAEITISIVTLLNSILVNSHFSKSTRAPSIETPNDSAAVDNNRAGTTSRTSVSPPGPADPVIKLADTSYTIRVLAAVVKAAKPEDIRNDRIRLATRV